MKKIMSCLTAFLFSILLTGCAGIAPENRAYPLALLVDYDAAAGKYLVEYSMADLSAVTGQNKDSAQESSQKEREELTYGASTMEGIEEQYRETQEKFLDLGHIKAIILGKELLGQPQKLKELFAYLQKQSMLGQRAFVMACENSAQLKKISKTLPESLGEYLTKACENSLQNRRQQPVHLSEVFYQWYEYGKLPPLPVLRVRGEKISLRV